MRLISTKICKTSDIGINNNLFGGTMLAWIDESAGTLAAEEACSQYMVTLKMDQVLFKKPVKVNDHIRIYGKVVKVGKSSLTLMLEARRFDFTSQHEDAVCSTTMTFVKLNPEGLSEEIRPEIRQKINSKIEKLKR